jgi:hypothetical protein
MVVALVRLTPVARTNWHRHAAGAAADTFMSHLAMLESLPGGEDPTTWVEPVPDEDYQRANEQ